MATGAVPPPPPPRRTKWTRRVPHPVLTGHAASLTAAGDVESGGGGGTGDGNGSQGNAGDGPGRQGLLEAAGARPEGVDGGRRAGATAKDREIARLKREVAELQEQLDAVTSMGGACSDTPGSAPALAARRASDAKTREKKQAADGGARGRQKRPANCADAPCAECAALAARREPYARRGAARLCTGGHTLPPSHARSRLPRFALFSPLLSLRYTLFSQVSDRVCEKKRGEVVLAIPGRHEEALNRPIILTAPRPGPGQVAEAALLAAQACIAPLAAAEAAPPPLGLSGHAAARTPF